MTTELNKDEKELLAILHRSSERGKQAYGLHSTLAGTGMRPRGVLELQQVGDAHL